MKIQVMNGVNLDLLGNREPEIYGNSTLHDIEEDLQVCLKQWKRTDVTLQFLQTNDEGQFLNGFEKDSRGYLVNPGAWTHTSLALADRLKGLHIPYAEIHLSNLSSREKMRHRSLISPEAVTVVSGGGSLAYEMGLWGLLRTLPHPI